MQNITLSPYYYYFHKENKILILLLYFKNYTHIFCIKTDTKGPVFFLHYADGTFPVNITDTKSGLSLEL